jgi:hypothetical protein
LVRSAIPLLVALLPGLIALVPTLLVSSKRRLIHQVQEEAKAHAALPEGSAKESMREALDFSTRAYYRRVRGRDYGAKAWRRLLYVVALLWVLGPVLVYLALWVWSNRGFYPYLFVWFVAGFLVIVTAIIVFLIYLSLAGLVRARRREGHREPADADPGHDISDWATHQDDG